MSPRRRPTHDTREAFVSTPAGPPVLGELERAALRVVLTLRRESGREPSHDEVARQLGQRDVKPVLEALERAGLLSLRLTEKQHRCLTAIIALEARLGRSPSTREVDRELGLAPGAGGARFHIKNLVRMGLVTKPEVVLVLRATEFGRAFAGAER